MYKPECLCTAAMFVTVQQWGAATVAPVEAVALIRLRLFGKEFLVDCVRLRSLDAVKCMQWGRCRSRRRLVRFSNVYLRVWI